MLTRVNVEKLLAAKSFYRTPTPEDVLVVSLTTESSVDKNIVT
jgi:hypothetical protein